jgi:hypothetical protein
MSTNSATYTSDIAPRPTISLPAELRNQIHEYVAANILANSSISAYSGYLLASKQTWHESAPYLYQGLNEELARVNNAWYKATGTDLNFRQPSTLGEAACITVGLPKSYFFRINEAVTYSIRPLNEPLITNRGSFGFYPRTPPLEGLLGIHCSTLKFYLYDDPAFLSLDPCTARIARFWMEMYIRLFCQELHMVAAERQNTEFLKVAAERQNTEFLNKGTPDQPGRLVANRLVFEWGVLYDNPRRQRAFERKMVGLFRYSIGDSRAWWRHQLRTDGTFSDMTGVPMPEEKLVDSAVLNRKPTTGIVLDKIESRGEADPITGGYTNTVYSKDVC